MEEELELLDDEFGDEDECECGEDTCCCLRYADAISPEPPRNAQ